MTTNVQNGNSLLMAMQSMMQEMNNASLHGEPDIYFARLMQLHHAGAINMCDLVSNEGQDLTIAGIASALCQKQKEEIADLQLFLNNHRPMPHSESAVFNTEMKNVLERTGLNAEQEELTDSADHDFVALMILHHQQGIDMANLIIEHGSNPDIKKLAGIIKTDREMEIEILLKWLNNHRGQHSPA